ncbi:MAG: HAMP domain-containing histidine kinase [Oscillospiraceae bacterium]|nr:HAMP domain-containing histidine kinase [Oscillospiraceae bacterium]
MKIDIRGMKFQTWVYLTAFSAVILIVLWVLQFLFLDRFYYKMKLDEIRDVGDKIVQKIDPSNFYDIMSEYAFNNNLRIILLDETGMMTGRFDGFRDNEQGTLTSGVITSFPRDVFGKVRQQFEETGTNKVCFINDNEWNDMSQAIYAAKIPITSLIAEPLTLALPPDSSYYLYISGSVPPIDSTVSVLRTQFIIITVILFALSLAAALWISRRMTRPIAELTKSSERLAKGELDAAFYNEGFTEINRMAAAMNYAAGELRNLDNYRKEFIANVSHDLKTPLTIIKFYGEMIKDISGNDSEKRAAHCDMIAKEADWLSEMVEEILELSKFDSGVAGKANNRIDLSRCLQEVLAGFQVLSEKDGYVFENDIAPDLYVCGSETALRRVCLNLISNAVNYTGEDKRIFVLLKDVGEKVRFEVTDTGEGVPEDKKSVIWDRYYKSNETHKRAVVGTGLGLFIVKSILSQYKERYGVTSEIGKGSTFWFELKKCDDFSDSGTPNEPSCNGFTQKVDGKN